MRNRKDTLQRISRMIELKENEIKLMDSNIKLEVPSLVNLDTNIIIEKLEHNRKVRLTTQDMFEVLK